MEEQFGEIEGGEGAITCKDVHFEFPGVNKLTLANLDETAKVCYAVPSVIVDVKLYFFKSSPIL